MLINSISNSRLHCCLIALILFILIFLFLPLLLIYIANTSFEEQRNQSNVTEESRFAPNCSKTVEFGFQCPIGRFPCHSCPNLCIKQKRQCDQIQDCPDNSDESECNDDHGVFRAIYNNILVQKQRSQAGNSNESSSSHFPGGLIPDGCGLEDFLNNTCPCKLTDNRIVLCEKQRLTSVPNTLLSTVIKINLSNNSISNIDQVMWPRSLSSLVMVNNSITSIGESAFEQSPNLSRIYLSNNLIDSIHIDALKGLTRLSNLQLEDNQLKTFHTNMLIHTPHLVKLYLAGNMIDLPESTSFNHCSYLRWLVLDNNKISAIRANYFSHMSSLTWLTLAHNEITFIEPKSFEGNFELEDLNLSFNKLKIINRQIFATSLNIRRLQLADNELEPLPADALQELLQLKSLNLSGVEFDFIRQGTFNYLRQLEFIYFEKFRYCHYAYQVRVCRPITDGLSSMENLLVFPTLKYAVWIVASACCLGNVFVFIWRSISPNEEHTLSLFVRNLSIADLMMGIYLAVIGWQDSEFEDKFGGPQAIKWMSSWTCTGIGFLAILSSELSVFILTIITVERYKSIISIERYEEEDQKRQARLYIILAWFLSLMIASYPIIEWFIRSSEEFYATNGLCLPLHIDQPFTPGWKYSAFIYLGINFSAVIIIIALYVHMYSMIMSNRHFTRPVSVFKSGKREDIILAIRFFFIVVTDCLCWIPIVVIKLLALANVSISSSIYGWLVVFIIPINSALNPILYTLSAPTSLQTKVCMLFQRICYRVDSITFLTSRRVRSKNYSPQSTSSTSNNHCYADASQQTAQRILI